MSEEEEKIEPEKSIAHTGDNSRLLSERYEQLNFLRYKLKKNPYLEVLSEITCNVHKGPWHSACHTGGAPEMASLSAIHSLSTWCTEHLLCVGDCAKGYRRERETACLSATGVSGEGSPHPDRRAHAGGPLTSQADAEGGDLP